MKVERKEDAGRVLLSTLPLSSTFEFVRGGDLCMKVDSMGHAPNVNYVGLVSGRTGFTRDCRVFPVAGKFVEE